MRPWRFALALASVAALSGCVDGPFARVNPHDAGSTIEIRLVPSRDTLTITDRDVAIQVVTNPVTSGYLPRWRTSDPQLSYLGEGQFRLTSAATSVTPVVIEALYMGRSAQVTIYKAPAP